MIFFDDALAKVFNLIESLVAYIENLVGVNFIQSFTRLLEQIHSAALLIGVVLVLISGLSFNGQVKMMFPWLIYVVLLSPIIILLLSFWAETFHGACQDLINANRTTVSNQAYFRFSGFLTFVTAIATFLAAIYALAQGSFGPMTNYFVGGMLFYGFFLLLFSSTLFNPTLLNIEEDKASSGGEDFVALFAFQLKALLYFQKIVSRILIIVGGFCLIVSIAEVGYFVWGVGLLLGGILYPFLVYMIFVLLYFWFSLLQSLLKWSRS
tara:strand:- start:972 stop:1769 length:798 start_codon:yes stop_codon:yes gene_type:complete